MALFKSCVISLRRRRHLSSAASKSRDDSIPDHEFVRIDARLGDSPKRVHLVDADEGGAGADCHTDTFDINKNAYELGITRGRNTTEMV